MRSGGDLPALFGLAEGLTPAHGNAAEVDGAAVSPDVNARDGAAPCCESTEHTRERTRAGLNEMRLAYAHFWRARLDHSEAVHLNTSSVAPQRSISELFDAAEVSYKSAIRSAALGMQERHEEARGERGMAYAVSELRNNKTLLEMRAWLCLGQLLVNRARTAFDAIATSPPAMVHTFDSLCVADCVT